MIGKPISEALDEITDLTNSQMADTVIDTTGHYQVFTESFKVARTFGKIVLLGDTGTPSRQCLSHDVINRGLTIVGAHDVHETPDWNSDKIIPLFFRLVSKGRFNLDGLISHRFAPADCAAAYEVANQSRDQTMGILFQW